jgi:mono/diheme cytochrome c family protein
MNKYLGAIIGFMLVLFSLGTVRQGLDDAWDSITHWRYYPIRDMRRSVVIIPNHTSLRGPDAESVPVTGKELTYGLESVELATKLGAMLHNPVAADDSSIARGQRKFLRTCVPCHGAALAGDGPVAATFMPPPDLLAQVTRDRPDGYIYSYIRHGGVVMPSYGAQVTAEEAWNLINYIRHMQKTSPR